MDQALELLPADYWRWRLTAYGPEHSDSAFTWEDFQASTNKDLADVLGNFVNRIVKFARVQVRRRRAGGRASRDRWRPSWRPTSRAGIAEATASLRGHGVPQGLPGATGRLGAGQRVSAGGRALDGVQDRSVEAAVGVRTGLNLVALFARLAAPVMPFSAEKIAAAVGETDLSWPAADEALLDRAAAVARPLPRPRCCSRRSRTTQVAEWSERFGGAG